QGPATGASNLPLVAVTRTAAVSIQPAIAAPPQATPATRAFSAPRVEPVMSDDEAQWRARAIPELAPIAGVEFKEIQPAPLTIPQLSVQAIGTAAIAVAPIDRIPGER